MQPFTNDPNQAIQGLLADPSQVSNVQLQWLRNQYSPTDYMQGILAPMEHQAYSREIAQEGPGGAVAGFGGPIAYYLAKSLGALSGRTGPSLDEMFAGMRGAVQGMRNPFAGSY